MAGTGSSTTASAGGSGAAGGGGGGGAGSSTTASAGGSAAGTGSFVPALVLIMSTVEIAMAMTMAAVMTTNGIASGSMLRRVRRRGW